MTPTNKPNSKFTLKRALNATDDAESSRKKSKLQIAAAEGQERSGTELTQVESTTAHPPLHATSSPMTPRSKSNCKAVAERALDATDIDQSPRKRLKQTVPDIHPPISPTNGEAKFAYSPTGQETMEDCHFATAESRMSSKGKDLVKEEPFSTHASVPQAFIGESSSIGRLSSIASLSSLLPSSSIDRLPVEILAHIFAFHVSNAPLGYDPDDYDDDLDYVSDPDFLATETMSDTSYIPDKLGWARVTHVCQKWRYIALDDARLWSTFVLDLPEEFTLEILRRSKGALLELTVPVACQYEVIGPVLKNHMHRVRTLTLDNLSDAVAPVLSLPAPQLEELDIPFAFYDGYRIPVPFLADTAPRLTSLSVAESLDFPWDSPVLNHLVELTVERSAFRKWTSDIPSPDAFFRLLKRMDRIQVLKLRNCVPIVPHLDQGSRIPLPMLTHLELDGTSDQCANVLERIDFPTSARFFMACRAHHFAYQRMFKELRRHFQPDDPSEQPLFRTLCLTYGGEQCKVDEDRAVLGFRAWRTSCVDDDEGLVRASTEEPDFYQDVRGTETKLPDVRLTFAMKTWFIEQESYRLCAMIPLHALRVLSMDVRGTRINPESVRRISWPIVRVLNMFWDTRELVHLRLGGNGSVDSRQAVQFFRGMRQPTRGDDILEFAVFPDLRTLTLMDVNAHFDLWCTDHVLIEVLQDMLRRRKMWCTPIDVVYIKERLHEDKDWKDWRSLENTTVVYEREIKLVEEGCKRVPF